MTTNLLRRAVAASAASALALAALVASGSAASAAVPGFEPDTANQYGQLTFYDASGVKVTSGSTSDAPFAAYAVATSDDPTTANYKATLYGYAASSTTPINGWTGKQMTLSTAYPVTDPAAPSVVTTAGSSRPVVTLSSSSLTLANLASTLPNSSDPTYPNIYQLRVKTTGSVSSTKWWAADIQISGSAWQQVYPNVPQKQVPTVALSASPAGSAYKGQSVTFTATIGNGGPGTVQFAVDGTNKGTPVTVSSGSASATFNDLSPNGGPRSITAAYTPSDTTMFTPASSSPLSYTIKDQPFITAGPTVTAPHNVGDTVTCAANSDDPNATRGTTWTLNGSAVANGDQYTIPENGYAGTLSCAVAFTNPAGVARGQSDGVTVGAAGALRLLRAAVIRGKHISGARLSATSGTWSPTATSYSYQWFVNGRAVRGATRTYFSVPRKSRGKVVAVRVIAKRYGHGNGATLVRVKIVR